MKMWLVCSDCAHAHHAAHGTDAMPAETIFVEAQDLNEVGLYEATCPHGHVIREVLQNAKHEILFDAAALALLDGYYREAIATFWSALERAFEHFARVAAWRLEVPLEAFEATWAAAGKSSERQYGIFLFAHASLTRRPPSFWKAHSGMAGKRNDVVHGGLIVDCAAAVALGTFVFDAIRELANTLAAHAPEATVKETHQRIRKAGGSPDTTSRLNITMSMGKGSFEEALAELQNRNSWFAWHDRITLGSLARDTGRSPSELLRVLEDAIAREYQEGPK